MRLLSAVGLTLVCFLALFSFQLLWTQDRLEHLRDLGRRGLHIRRAGRRQQLESGAEQIGARLDRLAAAGADLDQAAVNAAVAGADSGDGGLRGGPHAMPNPAIIVFCYNRTDYLNQTLHSLMGLQGLSRYSLYISQDGDSPGVAELVGQLGAPLLRTARDFSFWRKAPRVAQLPGGTQPGHAWLAQHYKWGLDRLFNEHGHSHVVILEDDMLFSPDFLLYFEATAPLLDADPSLWCVSSWNDNGFEKGHGWDVRRLFRTSYFPGLGWMMKRELWQELGPKWPLDHWDHWMRDEEVSRGRECICPEVNRNKNIGEVGANMNKQAFKRYLKTMAWNADQTVVDYGDLSGLLRPAYEAALQAALAAAEPFEFSYRRDAPQPQPGKTYLIPYVIERYTRVALKLKLWPYPRGHHQHVAIIPWENSTFLVADRRFCPLLPKEQQLPPTPGMRAIPGERHQSCHDVCEARGLVCYSKDFWWLNSCSVMRKHFPCEKGCTIELGPDVPAYVADANQTLHKYCLITQKASTCHAKHAATARLCACIPRESPKGGGTAHQRRHTLAAAGSGEGLPGGGAAQALRQQQRQQQRAAAATALSKSSSEAALEVG